MSFHTQLLDKDFNYIEYKVDKIDEFIRFCGSAIRLSGLDNQYRAVQTVDGIVNLRDGMRIIELTQEPYTYLVVSEVVFELLFED